MRHFFWFILNFFCIRKFLPKFFPTSLRPKCFFKTFTEAKITHSLELLAIFSGTIQMWNGMLAKMRKQKSYRLNASFHSLQELHVPQIPDLEEQAVDSEDEPNNNQVGYEFIVFFHFTIFNTLRYFFFSSSRVELFV